MKIATTLKGSKGSTSLAILRSHQQGRPAVFTVPTCLRDFAQGLDQRRCSLTSYYACSIDRLERRLFINHMSIQLEPESSGFSPTKRSSMGRASI
jgi:hypothetical protein